MDYVTAAFVGSLTHLWQATWVAFGRGWYDPWILFALLSEQRFTDESLETLLTEVEYILNSRPLTPVVMDSECQEPLTPNHLLLAGHEGASLPPGVFLCGGQLRLKAMETGAEHHRPVLAPLDQGVFANTAGSTELARCADESCRGPYGTVVRRASPSS